MTPPIAAVGRIVIPYTVDGMSHVMHLYVRNPQYVGGNWMINTRTTDANDLNWTTACTAITNIFNGWISAQHTNGAYILQTRSGSVWTPVATNTSNWTPTGAQHIPAAQLTVTLRDKLFYRTHIVWMEGLEPAPGHSRAYNGGIASTDAVLKQFTELKDVANAPYYWLVSRANQYLADFPFVSFTSTYNRKLRRARGLA